MEKIKKYLNYLFLNTKPGEATENWARVGKSVEWTDTMNPKTADFDFIEDSAATTELEGYKPTTSMPLTAYVGDAVYDFVFDLYNRQVTGSEAVTKALRVYQQPIDGVTPPAQVAALTDVLVTVESYNIATGVLTFTLAQRGDPKQGGATIADGKPVFTPAADLTVA